MEEITCPPWCQKHHDDDRRLLGTYVVHLRRLTSDNLTEHGSVVLVQGYDTEPDSPVRWTPPNLTIHLPGPDLGPPSPLAVELEPVAARRLADFLEALAPDRIRVATVAAALRQGADMIDKHADWRPGK